MRRHTYAPHCPTDCLLHPLLSRRVSDGVCEFLWALWPNFVSCVCKLSLDAQTGQDTTSWLYPPCPCWNVDCLGFLQALCRYSGLVWVHGPALHCSLKLNLCVYVYAWMYVCSPCVCVVSTEARFPETGVTGGCWESSSGLLQNQPVVWTSEHLSSP